MARTCRYGDAGGPASSAHRARDVAHPRVDGRAGRRCTARTRPAAGSGPRPAPRPVGATMRDVTVYSSPSSSPPSTTALARSLLVAESPTAERSRTRPDRPSAATGRRCRAGLRTAEPRSRRTPGTAAWAAARRSRALGRALRREDRCCSTSCRRTRRARTGASTRHRPGRSPRTGRRARSRSSCAWIETNGSSRIPSPPVVEKSTSAAEPEAGQQAGDEHRREHGERRDLPGAAGGDARKPPAPAARTRSVPTARTRRSPSTKTTREGRQQEGDRVHGPRAVLEHRVGEPDERDDGRTARSGLPARIASAWVENAAVQVAVTAASRSGAKGGVGATWTLACWATNSSERPTARSVRSDGRPYHAVCG